MLRELHGTIPFLLPATFVVLRMKYRMNNMLFLNAHTLIFAISG